MSPAVVAATTPIQAASIAVDAGQSAPPMKCATKVKAANKDVLITQAAIVKAARDGGKVDKDAVATLTAMIAEHTANTVSRDTVLAHTVLLAAFHHQLHGNANDTKGFAFLCAAETRYLAFMDALAKAVLTNTSLVKSPPLPPLDVAMFWHAHMLSPIRFSDDMQRCFGDQMLDVDFPLLRMAKVISGTNKDDLKTAHAFWAAHMPASMPYDLTPALVDETKTTVNVICPTCQAEETMDMAEYAPFRLHAKEHMCVSCACEFTAEHVAVDRFLKLVASTPAKLLAGIQLHPLTQVPAPNDRANIADIAALFAKDEWAKRVAKLPFLATWDDVKSIVFAPIMAAKRDALVLPGNRFRFGMILRAHQDVTTGPWSMDMVRAVRRQQRFSSKIAAQLQHGGVHNIYHLHTEALVQYPKFLAMLVAKPRASLVPTTAIDLAWHTHQLFPAKYAAHTMVLAGHVVNHDDSDDAVSEERIAEGAKAMPELWMEVFDEEYFAPNVSCAMGNKYKVDELEYHRATRVFFLGQVQCHSDACKDSTLSNSGRYHSTYDPKDLLALCGGQSEGSGPCRAAPDTKAAAAFCGGHCGSGHCRAAASDTKDVAALCGSNCRARCWGAAASDIKGATALCGSNCRARCWGA